MELERRYREMENGNLLHLATHPEELTPEARTALARELNARGLAAPQPPIEHSSRDDADRPTPPTVDEPKLEQGFSAGIPGVFPSSAAIMEKALVPAGEVVEGRVRLSTFFDGHDLSRACETLEAAGIIPQIEPVAGDAMSGVPPRFDIWIEDSRLEQAEVLLREKLGLFPVAEEQPAGEPSSEGGRVVVAELESENESVQAVRMLREKGIDANLEDRTLRREEVYRVEVRAADRERALAAVAASLGVKG